MIWGDIMITLIGKDLAKEGNEFVFYGPAEECESCRVKSSCIGSLEKGHKYKIVEVRDVEQKCALHNEGKVNVVIVEEAETIICTQSKVFEGSNFNFENFECDDLDCDFRELCFAEGINSGDKCTFIENLGKFEDCPKGNSLTKVIVKLNI